MKCCCRTCGKTVHAKKGKLSCCGITEDLNRSLAENRSYARAVHGKIKKGLDFDPVFSHWNENDQEFSDYEGIPNT